jgi:predicted nucleotidyltransferase
LLLKGPIWRTAGNLSGTLKQVIMPLSKRYIDTKPVATPLDRDRLAAALEAELSQVVFAYLHGSAAGSGVVPAHSDLDVALFVDPVILDAEGEGGDAAYSLPDVYVSAAKAAESVAPGVRCDIGILNGAEPVFRFEVLKGQLLFCRDQEQWLRFYSLTCREYESRLFHYEKQHRYRLEAQS